LFKLRDIVVSLSLANICFIQRWAELLYHDPYYIKYDPRQGFAALLVCVLMTGAVFYTASLGLRNTGSPYLKAIGNCCVIATLIYPLNFLRKNYAIGVSNIYGAAVESLGSTSAKLVFIILGLSLFILVFKFSRPISSVVRHFAFLMAPFIAVTFGKSLWLIATINPAAYADTPSSAVVLKVPNIQKIRVIWIIFDELDQQYLFEKRPPDLILPEIDRLKAASFYAANAFPPAGSTLLSIPSLITGKIVRNALPDGTDQLMLDNGDSGNAVKFSEHPNVFTDAQALGYTTSSIGWHHPLCRVMKSGLNQCSWYAGQYYSSSPDSGLLQEVMNQYRDVLNISGTTSLFTESMAMRYHKSMLTAMLEESRQAAGNPDVGLVMLHLPTPHKPYCYDRQTNQLTQSHIVTGGYFNNLALVDRTVKEIRSALEQKGLADRTAVIISSDHWWRDKVMIQGTRDKRVPFLVMLPQKDVGTVYDKPFNTVLTRQIIGELLAGRVADYSALVRWLDAHRTIGKSPYY